MAASDSIDSFRQSAGWLAALEEARQGFSEGGLPVGACVVSKSGKVLGRGHNMLVQNGTPQMHVCSNFTNFFTLYDALFFLICG